MRHTLLTHVADRGLIDPILNATGTGLPKGAISIKQIVDSESILDYRETKKF